MTAPYVDAGGNQTGNEALFYLSPTGVPIAVTAANPLPVAGGGGAGGAATTAAAPGYVRIEDGLTTNLAAVLAFHNADRQTIPANGYGLLTGGVAQLLNAGGSLDRARGTGVDGVAAVGLPAGSSQNAMAFTTTSGPAVTANVAAVFTPAVMSGSIRGVTWSIQVGSVLLLDTAAAAEVVVVAAVTATTFTTLTTKAHNAGVALTGFVYNQQRDGTLADGANPAGVNASVTYFWNQALNAGVGGLEIERSAAGELDGASGAGTAVAAEYEWNGGGPVGANGLEVGANFDRARSVQAKGLASGTVAATTAGAVALTFPSAAAAALVSPGEAIRLRGGAVMETVYATQFWVPGSGAVVPLVYPVVNSGHVTGEWDTYNVNGPGLSGFLATGIGIEEEALYDPVTGLFYIERAATQDAMPAQNVVAEAGVLWNGTAFDRMRSNLSVVLLPSAAQTVTQVSADQVNVNGHLLHVILDVTATTGSAAVTVNGKDPASGKYYPLAAAAAVTAVGTTVLRIGPALTSGPLVVNDFVPRVFQVVVTVTGSVTLSVGYNLSE